MSNKRIKFSPNLIIFLCWLVYSFSYIGRYNYNASISLFIDDYGISHADAGLVTTFFFFAYAIGQFINGALCKHYNKYITFPIVLLASSAINLLMSFKIPFYIVKYLWFANGICQSFLWPTSICIIGENLDSRDMNRAILVMSTTTSVGTVLAYLFSAIFAGMGNYKFSFLLGAIVLAAVAITWFLLYSPNPNSPITDTDKTDNKTKNSSGISAIIILLSVLAIFGIVDNLVKDGVNTWLPTILKENFGMNDSYSILLTMLLPLLGILGATISINCNKFIKDFSLLIMCFFAISAILIGIIFFKLKTAGVVSMMICFASIICLMHSINNVITSMAPLRFRDTIDSGKTSGILNGFCYIGSTISSYGLGAIADNGGWSAVFLFLLFMCIASVVIGIMWFVINFFVSKKH